MTISGFRSSDRDNLYLFKSKSDPNKLYPVEAADVELATLRAWERHGQDIEFCGITEYSCKTCLYWGTACCAYYGREGIERCEDFKYEGATE